MRKREAEDSTWQTEIQERTIGPDHSGRPEGIASCMSRKTGKITVRDVLGHEVPGGVDVLFDGKGTKNSGCNELGQVQADRWFVCDAKNPAVRLAQVAPLRHESVQTTFVPKTHPDAGLFLLLKSAELSRE